MEKYVFFFQRSIKYRLMFFFILVSILPVVLVGLIPYQKSEQVVKKQVLEYAQSAIDQLNENIGYHLKEMELMSRMIYYQVFSVFDQDWQENSRELFGEREDSSRQKELKNFLMALKNNRSFIDEIHLIVGEQTYTTAVELKPDVLKAQEWYQNATVKTDEKMWTGPHATDYYTNNPKTDQVVTLIHSFRLPKPGLTSTLLIEMKLETLRSLFNSPNLKSLGTLLLIDKFGRIIYSNDETQDVVHTEQYVTNTLRSLGDENSFVYAMNFISGWKVAAFIPNDKIEKSFYAVKKTVFLLLGVFLLLSIFLGWTFADRFIKPLKTLQRDMSKVRKGDFRIRSFIQSPDEIGDLSRSFNQMVKEIERLIEQIAENERKKKEMELQSLQYQINPHFLYNTLNSVQWLAKLHHVPNISEMLTCLIKLLRESLKATSQLHMLEEELELLDYYIMIQKYRFEGNFEIEYYIDPDLLGCLVPRFTLQPLVENSFFHGFVDSKGKIVISAHRSNDSVQITIKDNGKGIDKETLKNILNFSEKGKTSSGIGIKNVHEKIKLYFGDPYGLHIESEPGNGTLIAISLPFMKKDGGAGNDEKSIAG